MVGEDDGRHTVEYDDHFMIIPETIATREDYIHNISKEEKALYCMMDLPIHRLTTRCG